MVNREEREMAVYDVLKSVYEEVYGGDGIPPVTNHLSEASEGKITIKQAVNGYRNYLQDKKGLEEEIIDSLDLPRYVELGAEKWVLGFPRIRDVAGKRDMVIEYELDC